MTHLLLVFPFLWIARAAVTQGHTHQKYVTLMITFSHHLASFAHSFSQRPNWKCVLCVSFCVSFVILNTHASQWHLNVAKSDTHVWSMNSKNSWVFVSVCKLYHSFVVAAAADDDGYKEKVQSVFETFWLGVTKNRVKSQRIKTHDMPCAKTNCLKLICFIFYRSLSVQFKVIRPTE